MELILKEDVVNLGYKNDIVTVKSGYGRNYLIPPTLWILLAWPTGAIVSGIIIHLLSFS